MKRFRSCFVISSQHYIFDYLRMFSTDVQTWSHLQQLTQVHLKKLTMGATSGRILKIFFFPFCSIFESLGHHRITSPQKHCLIVYPFSTPRTHFDHPKPIEILTTRREEAYRKETFDYSIWFRSVETQRHTELSKTLYHRAVTFDSSDTFSTARSLSKLRLLEEKRRIGKMLSIARYDVDQSKLIGIWSAR